MQMVWLCVHIVGAIIAFVLLFSVLDKKDSEYKSRLLMAVSCAIVVLVSKCLFIMATEVREMLVLGKIEYLGKMFANFFALTFILRYYKVHWSRKILGVLLGINIIMISIIMTCDYHSLYYSSIEWAKNTNGCYLVLVKAPLYNFNMAFMLFELLLYLFACFKYANKQGKVEAKGVQALLIGAGLAPFIMLFLYLVGLTGGFDTAPLGVLMSVFFLVVAVNKYGLFDLVKNAKEVVVESMNEGIIVANNRMQFLYANPSACKLFPDMKRGEGMVDASEIQAIYEQSGTVVELEGESYEIRSSEIMDGTSVRGYMISIVDITDVMMQAKMMKELKEKAEHAALVKSAFLANMSHEIRTPMNAILGMAEMALHGNLGEEEQEYIEQIKTASISLLTIINDILDFSKVESGKMEIVEADYDIHTMINDLSHIVSGKVKDKNLELKIEVNPLIPRGLRGDEIRLKQVLINLVNNAVKFTEKGSITLSVDYEKTQEGILLKVMVADTGIGIRQEDLERIFNAFEQSDTFRNRKKEGSGLGLAISRQLLTLMGGSIQVESAYQEGSKFSFEVPQQVVDETPCGLMLEEKKKSGRKEEYGNFKAPNAKILIVDDNLVNLRVAAGLMKPFEMQITKARSGQEAIELLKKEQYHIIFMDHMMPEMDGVEATHIIRAMDGEYYKNVPIIALTANAINGAKEMFLKEGLNDFIAKPISIRELSEKILDWLPFELLEET
ncbi:MAG: ATP-binding protein [Lachnospiraceae bacterium]|nr:ATP-binding protein [Lachnospiraceae bacterium]